MEEVMKLKKLFWNHYFKRLIQTKFIHGVKAREEGLNRSKIFVQSSLFPHTLFMSQMCCAEIRRTVTWWSKLTVLISGRWTACAFRSITLGTTNISQRCSVYSDGNINKATPLCNILCSSKTSMSQKTKKGWGNQMERN